MNGSVSPPGTLVLRRGLERLRASAMLKQGLLVFAASMVLNVCNFIAHAVASRELGVTIYGGLYALINAALIVGLPAAFIAPVLAQLAAEFRALHDDGHLRGLTESIADFFARLGLVYMVVAAFAAIPFAWFLHVPLWSAQFVGLLAGAAVYLSALRSIAQGTQDFAGFALSNSIEGIAKVIGIGILLAVGLKLGGGIIGFFVGPLCALVYLGLRLRHRYGAVQSHGVRYDWRRILNAGAGAAAATISLALIGSADVVLVKHFFSPNAAGLYAAAALGGKMLLYLVGFIPTVLLPQAADRHARGTQTHQVLTGSLIIFAVVALLRALRLPLLRRHGAPRARRSRLRCRGAVAGDVRPGNGLACVDECLNVIRYRNAPPRLYRSALAVHHWNAHSDCDDSSDASSGRQNSRGRQCGWRARGRGVALAAAQHERSALDRVKRVLLIGKSGRLGTAIRQRWTGCEIVAPSHAELPLEASERLREALGRIRPDVLVNAAAFHDVDRCEDRAGAGFFH